VKRQLLGFGNIRYDLLRSVRVKKPDFASDFRGLQAEQRNVEHLIHLCQANRIHIILSTYAYYLHEKAREDPRALKYREGVQIENEMIRALAARHHLPLVEIASAIPDDDAYFMDTVHFTPLGMQFLAERFAGRIAELLRVGEEARMEITVR
jgi:lysophospholipase L1-like esterase